MHRQFPWLIAALLLAAPAFAQEPDQDPEEAAVTDDVPTAEAAAADEAEQESQFDETGLDEQGFDNQDDDFRPSEDIPADQSIPFPTDI